MPRRSARFVVLLLLVLVAAAGCKQEITSGDYGPVTIGQPKLEALAALKANGLWPIRPILYNERRVENPSQGNLAKIFSDDAGILVWIGEYPGPVSIEFVDSLVSRTWPEYQITPSTPEDTKTEQRELARLKRLIEPSMSKEAVFDALEKFETNFRLTVGNFVVGYRQPRVTITTARALAKDPDYQKLILTNDGWQFHGLEREIWYGLFLSPFQSEVTIYFRNDRIERIEHEHFPFDIK